MTVGSPESEFDAGRCGLIVTLLTMDIVRPFYDLMGLRLSDPDGLPHVLRQEIITRRKKSQELPEAGRWSTPQVFSRAIAERLGTGAGRHLVWWGQHVFLTDTTRDHVNLRKWSTVLHTCRHEPGLWNRLGFPPGALDRFRQSFNLDEYRRRQAEVDAQPLSDWDLHLYALYLFDDNLYGPNDIAHVPDGPRLYVKPTIRAYQGYQFWAWVLSTLRPDQLDRLRQEGRRIVEEEGLQSAQGLPHPSILGIGL